MIRTRVLPAVVVVIAAIALGAIVTLQSEANTQRDAQLTLANLKLDLTHLQAVPFQASPTNGGSWIQARAQMRTGKREVAEALTSLRGGSPVPMLDMVAAHLRANYAVLDKIFAIAVSGVGFGGRGEQLASAAFQTEDRVDAVLAAASTEYDDAASTADSRATEGSAATISILILAFLFFYRRATRARSSAEQLAHENGVLASTDALTDLGNRRALVDDLAEELYDADAEPELLVALFDLDGFKEYNDTFGHPAGDTLLSRLGGRLLAAVAGSGTAYRMGGDEFCMLMRTQADDVDSLVKKAADALTEAGEGFQIECSFGLALIPAEASSGGRHCSWRIDVCTRTRKVAPRPAARAPTYCWS